MPAIGLFPRIEWQPVQCGLLRACKAWRPWPPMYGYALAVRCNDPFLSLKNSLETILAEFLTLFPYIGDRVTPAARQKQKRQVEYRCADRVVGCSDRLLARRGR